MLKILSQSSFVKKRLNIAKKNKRYESRKHLEDNISYKNIKSNKLNNNIKNDKDYSYILDFIDSTSKQNSSKKKRNIEKIGNKMNNNPLINEKINNNNLSKIINIYYNLNI